MIDFFFRDVLVIRRASAGAVDDYNQPSQTFSDLATVRGFLQPKTNREMALISGQGPVVGTWNVWLPIGTDVRDDDQVRDAAGNDYTLDNVRNAAGASAFIRADAERIQVTP